jgi:molecular chaperone DnaK (HSP70)
MTDSAKRVLSVGIDLGTSRSSISTSAGERHVVHSPSKKV